MEPSNLLTCDTTTLQAGPTLDALMAEFRGWEKVRFQLDDIWRDAKGCPIMSVADWFPSTDPAHAGELLDVLRKTHGVVLSGTGPWRTDQHWHLTAMPERGPIIRQRADTRALAICRAVAAWMRAKAERTEP